MSEKTGYGTCPACGQLGDIRHTVRPTTRGAIKVCGFCRGVGSDRISRELAGYTGSSTRIAARQTYFDLLATTAPIEKASRGGAA